MTKWGNGLSEREDIGGWVLLDNLLVDLVDLVSDDGGAPSHGYDVQAVLDRHVLDLKVSKVRGQRSEFEVLFEGHE